MSIIGSVKKDMNYHTVENCKGSKFALEYKEA